MLTYHDQLQCQIIYIIPETNIVSHINYTSINIYKKSKKKKVKKNKTLC